MSDRPSMKAIQIESFGSPAEVAKAVDVADVGAPAAGEVVIAVGVSSSADPFLAISLIAKIRTTILDSTKEKL